MVRKLEFSATLVRKIVKEDLRYKSYGLRKSQIMLKATKLQWLEKAKSSWAVWSTTNKESGSPHCNPLDYYVWGVAEGDVNKAPQSSKESLIAKFMEVFANMLREEVALALNQFHGPLEKIIATN